jgi:nucleoside-diphosphate-sugar epimerase
MLVLVTGVSGRIGANLAKSLIEIGHEVRGLVWTHDLRLEKLRGLAVEVMEGDLRNPADVDRAVEGVDAICHLGAAFQGGGPFTEEGYFAINLRGTFNVLEAARRKSDGLRHLFYASSDALYDKYVPGGMRQPIREDETPLRPRGWYALSKALGEQMCLGYYHTYGLPVTSFRFALTVAGDEILEYRQFYLRHWLQAYEGRQGEPASNVRKALQASAGDVNTLLLARDGRGRPYKKHIADVRDIVLGLTSALGVDAINGETVQLAGPVPYTWAEAIPYLAEALGLGYVDVRLAGQTPTYYEFDLDKARRLFGYQPRFDIYGMIDSAIACRRGEATGVIPTHLARE